MRFSSTPRSFCTASYVIETFRFLFLSKTNPKRHTIDRYVTNSCSINNKAHKSEQQGVSTPIITHNRPPWCSPIGTYTTTTLPFQSQPLSFPLVASLPCFYHRPLLFSLSTVDVLYSVGSILALAVLHWGQIFVKIRVYEEIIFLVRNLWRLHCLTKLRHW